MAETTGLTRKILVWSLIILSAIGYTAESLAGYLADSFQISFGKIAGVGDMLQPYGYLFAIAASAVLFTPNTKFKKYLFGTLFLASLASVAFGLHFEFTKSFTALLFTLLGLGLLISMPKMELWKKVFTGLIIGLLLGFDYKIYQSVEFSEYLKLGGTKFIDMIMMIVAPLIFFSLVSGINNMSDSKALGRVGFKAVGIYLMSAMFAVLLGLLMANIFNPGEGFDVKQLQINGAAPAKTSAMTMELNCQSPEIKDHPESTGLKMICSATEAKKGYAFPPLLQIFADFIPHNGLGALTGAEGKPNMIQVVIFAIFVGIALNLMGDQGKRIVEISHSSAQLMFKMISYIIKLSPYAVFGFMAWVSANLGIDAIKQLAWLVTTAITGMAVHCGILALMMLFIGKLNPIPFFVKSLEYQALAFSTSSSKATLTTAMKIGEEKLGISKSSVSFVLPLGAAINMDGTAIYLGICAVFFAQITGVHLDIHHYIIIIFSSTIASMGAAGYPGGSIVVMYMVLQTIGVTDEYIGILLGVDRVLDMFRTTINVTSDVALTAIIDSTEGTLDEKTYYASMEELANR